MKMVVKKIMIAGISIILGLNFIGMSSAQTTFDIDESFFDVTNFYSGNYSTVHFGTGNARNSFGGVFFWGPKIDKEVELEMNGSSVYCSKQIRGYYINQVRGNVVWPLDNQTLWILKGNYLGYENLDLEGGFFTHCTGDFINNYNGIFGYVKHTTSDGNIFQLWAGFKNTDHMRDVWGDSLGLEYNLVQKQFFVKGVIYDSYGGIGFIDSEFNPPMILRNLSGDAIYVDINIEPQNVSLDGSVRFDVSFGNRWDLFLQDVKLWIDIPKNIQIDWDTVGIRSGNSVLVFDDKLYPLQPKSFSFLGKAIKSGDFRSIAKLSAQGISVYDIVTGFVLDTSVALEQTIHSKDDLVVGDLTYLDVKIINRGNVTGYNMKLYDYLPKYFVYSGDKFLRLDDEKILLFSGDLFPGSGFRFKVPGYFTRAGVFSNLLVATSDNIDNITGELSINVLTNICGDGIVQKGFEYCDDGEMNGHMGYCNNDCTDNVIYGVACKYSDAEYQKNGPFIDTFNHWGFDYIEVMRRSCLHKGKWGFAGQWKYDPDEYVTRAEVLKTLVKIRGIAKDDFDIQSENASYNGVQTFADVPKNHWFVWYSFYAFDKGLTDGLYTTKNGKKYLQPDGPITRNDMIKAVMTLYKEIVSNREIDISAPSTMTDVKKWHLYYLYVRQAEKLGIISGYEMPDGTKTWQGNRPLTRAEFAKIVSIPFEGILFGSR